MVPSHNRGLKQRRRRRRRRQQRERQKGNRFRSAKQQLTLARVHHAFFCFAFLCCRCTITTWMCLISRFVEDVNEDNDFPFLSRTLIQSFRKIQKNLATFDELRRIRICAIKFEVKRIHVYILIRYPAQTNIKHLACNKHPQLGCVNTSRVRPSLLCPHQQNGWK